MKDEEHGIQVGIVNYFRLNHMLCFSVPNGGWRGNKGVMVGRKLKFEGLLRGVADLILLLPDGECVFIEVKAAKGRQSPEQKDFQA